ncbi:RraA family protein [Pseudogemmobacter humi]|uniref:4-hydroxy-4-methyl-2-oxoglutarate aldolase n=1 Tax=Pseudogemmobacter humi TaxID=2483812 RepID=A0A3P5WM91_9RHOB|nr:RraA family protein [Pseudogemmobacter humi]VDC22675.1 4-hydroxy-4-methyl-2-oxoglutarate aldolase [Pseudogemmobacter humi]
MSAQIESTDQECADAEVLRRLAALSTATLSDALDRSGIRGVVNGITRRSGSGRIAGFAETVSAETGELGSFSEADFAVFPIFNEIGRNAVLVIAMGGAETSTFGGLAGLILHSRGAAGVVIDGACRDVDELIATDITVASRHVTPRSGRGRMRILSRHEPVLCGEVSIAPRDLVLVDDTGVVVVPRGRVDDVLTIAEAIEDRDAAIERRIRDRMVSE